MILFFREKTCHILNLCRLSSGDEQIGCVLLWALLQRDDIIETIRSASEALELVALDIFAKNGWTNNNIICYNLFLNFPYNLVCSYLFDCSQQMS